MSKALETFRAGIKPGDRLECTENTYWTRPGGYGKLPPSITVDKNGPTVLHGSDGRLGFRLEWPKASKILESSADHIRYQFDRKLGETYTSTWKKVIA